MSINRKAERSRKGSFRFSTRPLCRWRVVREHLGAKCLGHELRAVGDHGPVQVNAIRERMEGWKWARFRLLGRPSDLAVPVVLDLHRHQQECLSGIDDLADEVPGRAKQQAELLSRLPARLQPRPIRMLVLAEEPMATLGLTNQAHRVLRGGG